MKRSSKISRAVETPEPRPSKRTGVPWEYAIALCGGLKAMKRGVGDNVAWNWEDRGSVPAEHVLAIYIERVRAAGGQEPASDPYAALDPPLAERLELTQKYYDLMGGDAWWTAMGAGMDATLKQHAAIAAARNRRAQRREARRATAG